MNTHTHTLTFVQYMTYTSTYYSLETDISLGFHVTQTKTESYVSLTENLACSSHQIVSLGIIVYYSDKELSFFI